MVSEISLPVTDQTTVSVNLTHWLKREGDRVAEGEAVCEVETDKATVEIPAPAAGVLRKILVPAGTEVPPKTVVGLVGEPGDALPEIDPFYKVDKVAPAAPKAPEPPKPMPAPAAPAPRAAGQKIIVSPRARRLAEERGVDLATITGSGPGGRILEEDVEAALAAPATAAPVSAATRAAQGKAERVSQSWQTIPHFYMSVTVDLTHMAALKAVAGEGVTFTDYFALALGQVLPQHLALNGHWKSATNAYEAAAEVRLGIVVEAEHGLVIPALADLRGRALPAIAAERAQVVAQARAGKLSPTAMAAPTFTLSNVGPGHIDAFTAIISPPQVAILTVGSVQPTPLVIDGQVVARTAATLTLGVDHRAVDGRQSARFLEDLKRTLETLA